MSTDLLAVYIQPASGSLIAPLVLSASGGGAVTGLEAGDLDNDGIEDLVAAVLSSVNAGRLVAWRGLAGGGFAAPLERPLNFAPQSLSLGDFDEDGRIDAASASASSAHVFAGDGAGAFAPGLPQSLGAGPDPVVLLDVNGDQHLDLAALSGGVNLKRLTVRLGDGMGGFGAIAQTDVASDLRLHGFVDLDQDGRPEAVLWNGLSVGAPRIELWRNLGAGAFGLGVSATMPARIFSVLVGDSNNDGVLELIASTEPSSFQVVPLLGPASVGATISADSFAAAAFAMELGDLTGDGRPELIIAGPDSSLPYVTTMGPIAIAVRADGAPQAPDSITLAESAGDFEAADLDSDGDLDLAAASTFAPSLELLRGNGQGSFAQWQTVALGVSPLDLAIADLNGDGAMDIFVGGQEYFASGSAAATRGRFEALRGVGNGAFVSLGEFQGPTAPQEFVLGDFNGDQHLDVLAGWWVTPLWLGAGGGSFHAPILFSEIPLSIPHVARDFNADGVLDVFVHEFLTGHLVTWLGIGNGRFRRGPTTINTTSQGEVDAVLSTDFDGDGVADLLVVNVRDRFVHPYHGNASGALTPAPPIPVGIGGHRVEHVDVDFDGIKDLLVSGFSPVVAVARGALAGGFEAPRFIFTGPFDSNVKALDIDGAPGVELVSSSGSRLLVRRR